MDKVMFFMGTGRDGEFLDGVGQVLCSLPIDKCAPNRGNSAQCWGEISRGGRWLIL
jgi:hypothetical protein